LSRPEPPLWPGTGSDRSLDVLGFGENSLDRVCIVDHLPRSGEKLTVRDSVERPGGQVATTVLGCARLDLRCAYAGAVGDDAAAAAAIAPLRAAGVELSRLVAIDGVATRQAIILVERSSGERCVLGIRDARLKIDPPTRDSIASARVLAIDMSDPDAAAWAARVARQAGTAVVLDADEPSDAVFDLAAVVDFPIVPETFAEAMGQGGSPDRALRELARRGPRLSVVTRGARGAVALDRGQTLESPGFAVAARDTTGAGDAFRSGFIWALLNEKGPVEALRVANATAAMNCRGLGAQAGLPTRGELEGFLAD